MKSVGVSRFSGPYFLASGLNKDTLYAVHYAVYFKQVIFIE